MGIKITRYEYTNKRKVFKNSYIFCSLFNIFVLFGLGNINYHNKELNKSKWLGGIIGTIQSVVFFAIVYLNGVFLIADE